MDSLLAILNNRDYQAETLFSAELSVLLLIGIECGWTPLADSLSADHKPLICFTIPRRLRKMNTWILRSNIDFWSFQTIGGLLWEISADKQTFSEWDEILVTGISADVPILKNGTNKKKQEKVLVMELFQKY